MAQKAPQFETKDLEGSMEPFTGTVGTTAADLPNSPGARLSYALFKCPADNTPNTKRLLYSVDGGTTYFTLVPGEAVGLPIKGTLTQVKIKGNAAGVTYEVMLWKEPS